MTEPREAAGESPAYIDRFISAQDAVRIHVRDYAPDNAAGPPVVCLPGLTRSVRDFHDLALTLSRHPEKPRRVVSVDYRGRGQSDYDSDWRNYNVITEAQDILAVLAALDIEHAAFVGTSRGGILIMLIAALRPGAIACAILNDVGPVIDVQGLLRIKRMLAELTAPATWEEAAANSKRYGAVAFPDFTDMDWEKMARQTYRDTNGRPAIDFDQTLAKTLDDFDADTPAPDLWPQFLALRDMPTLVIRGDLSGILSAETLAEMQARHQRLDIHVVENEGHAPTLWDMPTQQRIAGFIDRSETEPRPEPASAG